ncbi:hypothetical protein AMTRI_Chr12g275160 [Amborella trichopoda]
MASPPFHGNHLTTLCTQPHQRPILEKPIFSLLKSSNNRKTLLKIHGLMFIKGLHKQLSLSSLLINKYAESNDLESSMLVFQTLEQKAEIFVWNSIIKVHLGDPNSYKYAISLFKQMQFEGIRPDTFTFPLVIKACSGLENHLEQGKLIHTLSLKMGFVSDIYTSNSLIDVYIKSSEISLALQVFNEMPHRDVVSWTSIIMGFVHLQYFDHAFLFFHELQLEGLQPNSVTLLCMFQVCSLSKNLVQGRLLHCYTIKNGFDAYLSLQNSILTMYAKTGNCRDAERFLSLMVERDIISWNTMISGYVHTGEDEKAMKCFSLMQAEAMAPSPETMTIIISSCAQLGVTKTGKCLHNFSIRSGLLDVFVETALLDMYSKCGEIAMAFRFFHTMRARNMVSWSAMISGFARNGYSEEAIVLFKRMQYEGPKPGSDALRSLVLACSHIGALLLGRVIHGYLIRNGFYEDHDMSLKTSMVDMYAKCGCMELARKCFEEMHMKDVVSWTAMIDGYGMYGHGHEALQLFGRMEREGIKPNQVTFVSVLSACSHAGLIKEGLEYFNYMSLVMGIKPGLNHYTCLVDLLGRAGKLQEAWLVIKDMPIKPDSRIWGALLNACKIHSNLDIAVYAAKNVLELEPENIGYNVVLCNIHSWEKKWGEAEKLRKLVMGREMRKKPGWSFIEEGGGIHGFIAGDRTHFMVEQIYGALGCLVEHMREMENMPDLNDSFPGS